MKDIWWLYHQCVGRHRADHHKHKACDDLLDEDCVLNVCPAG